MFTNLSSRLNKAVEASRDALGNIQSTLKDPATLSRTGMTPSTSLNNLSSVGEPLLAEDVRISLDGSGNDQANVRTSMDGSSTGAHEGRQPLSSMSPEQVLSLETTEMQERLIRLRKFEDKFQDLAKAYKALLKKNQQIELVVGSYSPVRTITTTGDLDALGTYLRSVEEQREASVAEVHRLTRQVSEAKEVQQMESAAKADLLNSLQISLLDRDEEINRLKTAVQKLQAQSTTNTIPLNDPGPIPERATPEPGAVEDPSSPGTATDPVLLKLKLRELATALKRTSEQRNKAIERVKELQEANKALTLQQQENAVVSTSAVDDIGAEQAKQAATAATEDLAKAQTQLREKEKLLSELREQLSTTAHVKSAYDEENQRTGDLDKEMMALKSQIADLENEAAETKKKESAAQMEVLQLTQELQDVRKELDSARNESTEISSRISLLKEEHAEAFKKETETHNEIVNDLEIKAAEHAEKYLHSSILLEDARTDLALAIANSSEIEAALTLQTTYAESVTEQMARLESRIAELEGDITRVEKEKNEIGEKSKLDSIDHANQILVLQNLADQLKKEIQETKDQHQARATESAVDLVQLRSHNDEKTKSLQKALKNSDLLKASLDESTKNYDLVCAQVADLKAQLESSQGADVGRLVELESRVREYVNRIAELEGKLEAAQKENELQVAESKSFADRTVEIEKSKEELQLKLEEAETLMRTTKLELGTLRDNAASLESEKVKLGDALSVAREEADRLGEELRKATDSLARAEREKTELSDEKNTLDTLQMECESAKNECESLRTSLEEMTVKNQELNGSLEDYKRKAEDLLHSHAADIQQASEFSSRALGDAGAELETVRNELKARQESISHLETQLQDALASLASSQERISALEAELKTNESAQEDILQREKSGAGRVDELTKEIAELQNTIERLTLEGTEKANSVANLEERLGELSKAGEQLGSAREENASLTAQLTNAQAECSRLTEAHTTLERDMKVLTDFRRHLEQNRAETESRLRSTEEALAVAKQTVHARDEYISELGGQLAAVRQQLSEEEEKKGKSIQLLRNSKARILKLEAEIKAKEEAISKGLETLAEAQAVRERDLKEKDVQMANVTRQVEDMQSRLRKQQESALDLERRRKEFATEKDGLYSRIDELSALESSLKTERDQAREELQIRQAEFESSQSMLESQTEQLRQWARRVEDLESRSQTLDEELETSRRLFQTKSIENTALNIRISELEAKVYMNGQTSDELEAARREAKDARRDANERLRELRRKEIDAKEAQREMEEIKSAMERARGDAERGREEYEKISAEMTEMRKKEAEWVKKIKAEEIKIKDLELKIGAADAEHKLSISEREKSLEEMRLKEVQWKQMQKTLREEVRKLSRSTSVAGFATPTSASAQSPPPSRPTSTVSMAAAAANRGSNASLNSDEGLHGHNRRPSTPSGVDPRRSSGNFSHNSSVGAVSGMGKSSMSLNVEPTPDYMKEVILQFLETKDKTRKPHMLTAISRLLGFSPEELKRVEKTAL